MSGRRHTQSVRPSLLMFHIDRPIAQISSSLVLYQVLAAALSLWRRDHNHMDSYWASKVAVPESPIASSTRVSDSTSGVTPCIVMKNDGLYSWALGKGGAAGMYSNRLCSQSALKVQHSAVLSHQCHMPQWTSHFKFGSYAWTQDLSIATICPRKSSPSLRYWLNKGTRPVWLHSSAIVAPWKFHEISNKLQECGNPECRAEWGA